MRNLGLISKLPGLLGELAELGKKGEERRLVAEQLGQEGKPKQLELGKQGKWGERGGLPALRRNWKIY
tara:strand:- start:193 stop:396 length:204 start_codon:yes stop_codon:yes gene_type:complete